MKFDIVWSFPIWVIQETVLRQLCIWNEFLMCLIVFLFEFLRMYFKQSSNEEIRIDVTVNDDSMGNFFNFNFANCSDFILKKNERCERKELKRFFNGVLFTPHCLMHISDSIKNSQRKRHLFQEGFFFLSFFVKINPQRNHSLIMFVESVKEPNWN